VALLAAAALLLYSVFFLAIAAADRLLVVRSGVRPADVIVVLGGDWPLRGGRAAALFRAGLAPRILASGAGECDKIRRLMLGAGAPRDAIAVECASKNTIENAAFSAPILAAMRARSALLVTSWFHTRRALGSFEKEAPGIDWMSVPAERNEPLRTLIRDHTGVVVAEEYFKLAYYALRYGVSPCPRAGDTQGAKP
jgi:uncharacterized SAM-binding protein YcdF (DUF218 family)